MNKFLEDFINSKFMTPGKALDLGSGKNIDILDLKRKGWRTEGVDLNRGIDLEKPYQSKKAPFDLVYSNYVLHKIKNQNQFIQTITNNLKFRGWLFLHTFDKSDENSNSLLNKKIIIKLLGNNFSNMKVRVFDHFDTDKGHDHWHKILEVIAQKNN